MRYKPQKRAIIIDHVANYARHSLPDDDRQWSLSGTVTSKEAQDRDGDTPIVQCPECYHVFVPDKSQKRVCPACGYVFPKQERKVEHDEDAELQKITGFTLDFSSPDECTCIADLQRYAKLHGYKSGWVYYQARERGWIK